MLRKMTQLINNDLNVRIHLYMCFTFTIVILIGCTSTFVSLSTPQAPPSVSATFTTEATTDLVSSPIVSSPTPSRTPLPTLATPVTPEQPPKSYPPYGIVYSYPKSDWNESDRQDIRDHFEMVKAMGINTVVQIFSSRLIGTGREQDWLIFLDEAQRADIKVITRLWPLRDWTGQSFDFQPIESFLAVVQDHPALLAYLGLHEPLEKYNSKQLRAFYAGVKQFAPEVTIANFMGNMALFENALRFPGRDFSDGICDICIVWCTPARHENGNPVFVDAEIHETVRNNRRLIDKRDPDAKLWFLGQSYALEDHRQNLRMPTPEEMVEIFVISKQEGSDGFLWYPWVHNIYDQVLSDPDMEAQRQVVKQIYEEYILPNPNPW